MSRIAVLLVLLLAACSPSVGPDQVQTDRQFQLWRDPEYQVVCWVGFYKMACLPEHDVLPRQP